MLLFVQNVSKHVQWPLFSPQECFVVVCLTSTLAGRMDSPTLQSRYRALGTCHGTTKV